MELTYTDLSGQDVALLDFARADFAWGADENDFAVTLTPASGVPAEKTIIYAEDTDMIGIVRGYDSRGTLKLIGRTWTGELDAKVLCPLPGKAYYSVSGELNECLRALISRLRMDWLFSVTREKSGVHIDHTFKGSRDAAQQDTGRYMGGWSAMWQMLLASGCKVSARWDPQIKRVVLAGSKRADYTDDEGLATSKAIISASKSEAVNHLVCLGKGDMADRTVVHVYADKYGNVSSKQTMFGRDEIADTYDDANAEDAAELISDSYAKLKELRESAQEIAVLVRGDSTVMDVGDLVGGTDAITGISAQAVITKKVVTTDGLRTTASYETAVRS